MKDGQNRNIVQQEGALKTAGDDNGSLFAEREFYETHLDETKSPIPWNKGKLFGQKAPLKLKEGWAIRIQTPARQEDAQSGVVLKMSLLSPEWALQSRLADNPMGWMLQVNGLVIDIRHAPLELQQMAFAKGLIPFIPAERSSETI